MAKTSRFSETVLNAVVCYVDDEIEGIYRLLMSDYSNPVNIGNPHEITISDFAEEIIKLTGTTQKVVHKNLPEE